MVAAYKAWKRRGDFPSETSVTFSGQVFEFCQVEMLRLYAVSYCPRAECAEDDAFTVVNLPRWNIKIPKVGYDLTLLIYTLRLLKLALKIRPKLIFVCSGVTDWTFLSLLGLSGAKIVPILHNTLWPEGYPPSGIVAKLRRLTQQYFWNRRVWSSIAVSPAARRQVESLAPHAVRPTFVFRPSFPANSFGDAPQPMDFIVRPFRIVFAGRIEENKGVFDLLSIAERLSAQSNRRFEFSVCGDGPALAPLIEQIRVRGLHEVVKTHGRLARPELLARYRESHLVIVPTRSTFAEGFAMVVAEAILLLRPVLTSPVVPAGEVFGAAVALAKTDDVQSYAEQIERLSTDEQLYSQLVDGARQIRSTILDDSISLFATMRKIKVSALG